MKTIGIVGTRQRFFKGDFFKVREAFQNVYEEGDRICSGGCPRGADNFAELIAKENGTSILIHYPNWYKHGRAAGFVRNTLIAQDSDILIACVSANRKGGTEDTIKKFIKDKGSDENVILV